VPCSSIQTPYILALDNSLTVKPSPALSGTRHVILQCSPPFPLLPRIPPQLQDGAAAGGGQLTLLRESCARYQRL